MNLYKSTLLFLTIQFGTKINSCDCCCCCKNKIPPIQSDGSSSNNNNKPKANPFFLDKNFDEKWASKFNKDLLDLSSIVKTKNYNSDQDDTLHDKSIFDNSSSDIQQRLSETRNIFENYLSGTGDLSKYSTEEKRAIGSILGMLIGDSLGAPYEFQHVNKNLYNADNYTNLKYEDIKEEWTDDASMGLCIADSLILYNGTLNPYDVMQRFLSWWYSGYNNGTKYMTNTSGNYMSRGLGGNIGESFNHFFNHPTEWETKVGDANWSGNGSIMRNAAIPICFNKNIDNAMEMASVQSRVTHQGVEAAECCRLLTFIVCKLLKGEELKHVLNTLGSEFNTKINSVKGLINSSDNVESLKDKGTYENWNWKNKIFEYNTTRAGTYAGSFAMDNMAMSLHILYHTNSFEDALTVSSKLGGDADSVSSVVGQIAGAYYSMENIPKNWLKNIIGRDQCETILKGEILFHLRD